MSDESPNDLLAAWLEAVKRLRSVAGSIAESPRELPEDLVRGLFLPVDAMLQVSDQLVAPLRAQAAAFEQASAAFDEVAKLLVRQADLLEAASGAIRGPTESLKAVVGVRERPKR
jgi:hypothetical protein